MLVHLLQLSGSRAATWDAVALCRQGAKQPLSVVDGETCPHLYSY